MNIFDLTPEEQEIEDSIDQMESVVGEERERIEAILDRARKTQTISLRISEEDLQLTKKRAVKEGIPYQTLISSIVHRYVTDQLVETDEVRKIIGTLPGQRAM